LKKKPTQKPTKSRKELEMAQGERMIALLIGGFGGYLVAEFVLRPYPHPWHWLTALAVSGLGYLGMALWQRRLRGF